MNSRTSSEARLSLTWTSTDGLRCEMSHFTASNIPTNMMFFTQKKSLILIQSPRLRKKRASIICHKFSIFDLQYSKFRFPARNASPNVWVNMYSVGVFAPSLCLGIELAFPITAFSYLLVAGELKYSFCWFWLGWGRPQTRWLHAWTSDSNFDNEESHEHQRTTARCQRVEHAWKKIFLSATPPYLPTPSR